MNRTLNHGRRHFLWTALALAGMPGFVEAMSAHHPSPTDDTRLVRDLIAAVRNPASARTIGKAYLATCERLPGIDELVDALCHGAPSLEDECGSGGIPALKQALAVKQRQDFEHGRVVRVRGWILSATEAQLCSLVALAARQAV